MKNLLFLTITVNAAAATAIVCLCEGIVPVKNYVMAEHLVINGSSHTAGMQGQPQSLDDMTEGQIEDRFYQSVLYIVSWWGSTISAKNHVGYSKTISTIAKNHISHIDHSSHKTL